jgi:antagonist of KipI
VSRLHILRPGMFTTIQDRGRWGFQRWGVPVSGPMDAWSARLANRLVGNADATALLEVTLRGPEFSLSRDGWIAVTGARFDVEVGARRWRSPFVARVPGDVPVRFGQRQDGTRAYIAVDGGLAVEPTLGSASTHVRAGLGGLSGRALQAGDTVPLGSPATLRLEERHVDAAGPAVPRPGMNEISVLDVLVGAQDDWTNAAVAALCATSFIVSADSDRMGYRLTGGTTSWPEGRSALLSHPVTLGAVQLPAGGDPILLMADRQTTGGYAQIAVLTRASRSLAGQLGPGDRIVFRTSRWSEARHAHHRSEAALDALAPEVRA